MAGKKKKVEDQTPTEETLPTKTLVSPDAIDLHELFTRLREFENKALLDRLKVLERSISLLYKEILQDRVTLKEIKQMVSYLSLAHEELLNNISNAETSYSEEDVTQLDETDKNGKKWN